jgi:cellulose synthase/poly-beta-1,6-N-acetylglucosamine synthase-like glycosyltransferase
VIAAAQVVFWVCLLALFYVYLGYPLTLLAWRRRAPAELNLNGQRRSATVVIAAHNEYRCIAETVRNKLTQTFPPDLLHVIVISDASADGTDEAVSSLREPRVTLLRQESRQGKTAALNRGVAAADGQILVFSDANSLYAPDAVGRLIAVFADPSVGYVTGRLIYEDPGDTAVGGGSGMYMRYENWLRTLETRVGSVVGVNGGIDAVRRELYAPMRSDHLPDFVLPLRVVEQGYRVVYEDTAVAREAALGRQDDEFRMRVRVSLRALHALWEMRRLFRPRFGFFAFQLFVHKALRYLVVVAMLGALLSNGLLARRPLYGAIFAGQCLFYCLALVGCLSGGRIRLRPVLVPFYFCLVNLAAGVALVRFLRGERQVLWTPRKGA